MCSKCDCLGVLVFMLNEWGILHAGRITAELGL